ncbi:isocitrate/isopropylmalate dehydrogenase family protein [Marinithermus hydrothermalis]|uniref:Isocitrate/homoisocitrate dehydrogenase n=1 Tax=Marinithermus hydrothermalis (strain DSM 14884 / JCM 11576 / T1) TaxID=869210 RepID=F2NQQ4_MARHT|nr:isocitrate/isopropylmalate dehydrogenase family protein [Marinithermus hydrothermalis]AEB12268.1 3-isopropylmalate dehydrogenase [Marinithermus hydrothermalis DSM 14884]
MGQTYRICLIEGDGIGHEVVPAARRVLEATGLKFEFTEAEAGWETFEKYGTSVPEETVEKIRAADATLFGAATSPTRKVEGFFGAIRYLRKRLDLFANVRPAKYHPVPGAIQGTDLVVVRENTEGLYVEQERRYARGRIAIADRVITYDASYRIAEYALKLAQRRRGKLALVHKANVLPLSDGLFLEAAYDAAKHYPDVEISEVIVDACAMRLVRRPQDFDVLVMENLFGDIISDLTAGLVGGLGIAPSGNIGEEAAIFEPVHGSAPDIAGKGIANPTATILSAAMMLEHLGEKEAAERIERAVDRVLAEGPRTPDLGGDATTEAFTDAVIRALG